MKISDLISGVAGKSGLSEAEAAKALDATFETLDEHVRSAAGEREIVIQWSVRAGRRRSDETIVISSVDSKLTTFMKRFVDGQGQVDVAGVADAFRMSEPQLAETIGLEKPMMSSSPRKDFATTEARMTEMLEIIDRVHAWAGGEAQAMAWYRSQPIPALDGRTAEALVKSGQARAVRDYLDHLALGGFA